jgi:hypothetical protein
MSGAASLTPLQWRILRVLAALRPDWTLTGGAALGIHLAHRETRDVDLFFRTLRQLADLPREAEALLADDGLAVARIQTAPAFQRFRVEDGDSSCLVDLVADPVQPVTQPEWAEVGTARIQVDSLHEILVNKLCALLSRSELRDLVDIRAILAAGGDLERAMTDAPKKDGGFSPLVVAWLLRDWPTAALARSAGWGVEEAASLEAFHADLLNRIVRAAAPEQDR